MTPHPVTNERIAEIRGAFAALLPWVNYPQVSDLLARHDADTERIKALEAALRRTIPAITAGFGKAQRDRIIDQAEEALKGTS